MKKIGLYISAFVLAMGSVFTSCEDDKDEYEVTDFPSASTISVDVTDVAITNENLAANMATITFSASDNILSASDGTQLGKGVYWLEYSNSETFDDIIKRKEVTSDASSNQVQVSGLELNNMAVNVGAKFDVAAPVYFRINHSYNASSYNLGTVSNVVSIVVTPIEVPMITVVSKTDIEVVYATLQFNGETGRFEGLYPTDDEKVKEAWNKEWNFYFVDNKGVVYGCDDAWTGGTEGVGRSCKLVAGRAIGDDYSHWFDPSAVGDKGVTFWVDLSAMEWGFVGGSSESTEPDEPEELEKDQLGIRGNGDWDKTSNAVNPKIADDVYTYVIENVEISDAFKFFCNDKWIGVKDITDLSENISGDDNLSLDAGTYTLIIVAKLNGEEFTYESATAVKDGLGIRGNGDWDNTSNIVAPSISGSTYTYVIEDINIVSAFKFYCNGNWIGVKNIATIGDGFSGDDNLSLAPGTYNLTVIATVADDGSLTFNSVSAEQTAAAEKADLSNVELGIKGNGDWDNLQGAVTPTKNGDVYTYVISNVAITDVFKFVYGDNWLGYSNFESVDSQISSEGNDANLGISAGTYTFTVVLTANDDGTVTATSVTALKDE